MRREIGFQEGIISLSLKLGLEEKVRSDLSEPWTTSPRAALCPLRQQACRDGKSSVPLGRGNHEAGPASPFSASSGTGWWVGLAEVTPLMTMNDNIEDENLQRRGPPSHVAQDSLWVPSVNTGQSFPPRPVTFLLWGQ